MSEPINIEAQLAEICLKCGMCCDGTLFNKGALLDETDKNNAQDLFLETVIEPDGKYFFKQPCLYFNQCCTIYDKIRPKVCGTFFCNPLKEVQQGKLNIEKAKEIITKALEYRSEVLALSSQKMDYKNYTIRQLRDEILPHPSDKIKENKDLWLKMIGFVAIIDKIGKYPKAVK